MSALEITQLLDTLTRLLVASNTVGQYNQRDHVKLNETIENKIIETLQLIQY